MPKKERVSDTGKKKQYQQGRHGYKGVGGKGGKVGGTSNKQKVAFSNWNKSTKKTEAYKKRGKKQALPAFTKLNITQKLELFAKVEIHSAGKEGGMVWKEPITEYFAESGHSLSDAQMESFVDNVTRWHADLEYYKLYHILGLGERQRISYSRSKSLAVPRRVMDNIAREAFKVIRSGIELTSSVLDKLILKECLKDEEVILKSLDQKKLQTFLLFNASDSTFNEKLTSVLEKNKDVDTSGTFWPTRQWKSRLMQRYNIRYKAPSKTMYTKSRLFEQLVPSLEMTLALRYIYETPGGEGRLLNIDESMTYRYCKKRKIWTI